MRILGIDPGYGITGVTIMDYIGNSFKLVLAKAIMTTPNSDFNERLVEISKQISEVIQEYKPEVMAIEDLFFNNNIKTGIKVAQARGVILLEAKKRGLQIYEYTPLQVKQGVTGYGRATKMQIKQMVKSILKNEKIPKLDDITDSIAITICHAHSNRGKNLLEKYLLEEKEKKGKVNG